MIDQYLKALPDMGRGEKLQQFVEQLRKMANASEKVILPPTKAALCSAFCRSFFSKSPNLSLPTEKVLVFSEGRMSLPLIRIRANKIPDGT